MRGSAGRLPVDCRMNNPTPSPPSTPPVTAPDAPARRRTAWRVTGAVAVLVLTALGAAEALGWPFLRDPLAGWLQRSTGVPVRLDGNFRLHLLGQPRLAVDRIHVGAGDGVDVPHLVQAEGFELRWRWSDLWRYRQGQSLRVRSLETRTIDAHIRRLTSGAASWHVLPRAAGAPADRGDGPLPVFERLVLGEGSVQVDDAITDVQLQVKVSHAPRTDDPLPWKAEARGRYRGTPVQVLAQAQADLPLLLDDSGTPPLTPIKASGQVGQTRWSFEGATGAVWSGQGLGGSFSVQGPSLQTSGRPLGLTLPDTPPYRVTGRLARDGAVWSVSTGKATVGSSSLNADLQYDTAARPPRLNGRLGGARLALADLAPAVGADQPPARSDRVLPDERFDLPSLGRMDANVLVGIGQLDFGTPNLAPVEDLRLHLVLSDSRLTLDDLQARVAGGNFSGATTLQVVGNTPRWDARLRLAGVDLDTWVRGLRKADAATPQGRRTGAPAYLGGTLNASVNLRGTGNSVADILGGADGQLRLQVSQGQMSHLVTEAAGLDVAQALGTLISGDAPLRLDCAIAQAVVQDGVVKSRRIVLDNADSTLRVQGGASLRDEQLHLRLVAQPKDFSPLSLRTPVTVTGSFKQPAVGVEARGLLGRAAGAVLLGSLAPPAALLAFVDLGDDDGPVTCTWPDAGAAK